MERVITLPTPGPEVTGFLLRLIDAYWDNGGPNGRDAPAPEVITFIERLVEACLRRVDPDGVAVDADGDVIMGEDDDVVLPTWLAQTLDASLARVLRTTRLRRITLEAGRLHYIFD
ncbi:hypothetical protein EKO27_g4947 [Xylaria grammica]|uniref:Uncharacterized protein n=1 Tax=Xylaria grammica TaxID=363999 RepID=A0A439D6Y8_9PEZI|nr:hypothetical protein EKO27_g4947 [Xylaria grammica]